MNFKEGRFFSLLQSSANVEKLYAFRSGGILPANPMQPVMFRDNIYPGREKAHSIHQLTIYLQNKLGRGQCCFFEDLVHRRSDSVMSEVQRYAMYLHDEVYLNLKAQDFSQEVAERLIHFSDAQWYYMNLISEDVFGHDQEINFQVLQQAAIQTSCVVVGAYDMEGFVVWEKL